MIQRLNPLTRLRGRLTLTFTLVTGSVFIILWGGILLLIRTLDGVPSGAPLTVAVFSPLTSDIEPFLAQTPPDVDGLQTFLDLWVSGDTVRFENDSNTFNAIYNNLYYVGVTSPEDVLLAVEPQAIALGALLPQLPPDMQEAYTAVSQTRQAQVGLDSTFNEQPALYSFVPLGSRQRPLGTATFVFGPQSVDEEFLTVLGTVFWTMSGVILCGSMFMGSLFGWLASRGLVRRLLGLSDAAEQWAQGDFSAAVADRSKDEIGQLGRNLNQMAQQLDSLMETQTALATVEERNRLARDLHDTAKQQLFAASMQLSAARTVIEENPDHANDILADAESLIEQIHDELSTLIQALRPAALQDRGLVEAAEQFIADWQRQTDIAVELLVQNQRPLPMPLEQALYRVLQEGLANVAKHAQATQVIVRLSWQAKTITLEIHDNGVGFDLNAQHQAGFGLQSMNERLLAHSGLVTIDSIPNVGTKVTAIAEVNDDNG